MGIDVGPIEVVDGLVFHIDAGNSRSYSGSGNTVYNIALSSGIGATKTAGLSYTSSGPVTFIAPSDSNYLLSDYTLASGTSFTVCMWFKRQATAYWSALFANEVWNSGTGYVAYFSSATTLVFSRGGGSSFITYSNAGFASSNFNFYAFVKNPSGNNSIIYINGIEAASGSITDVTPTKPFLFNNRWINAGTSPSNADSRQSQFSNIAVYNRALSATEILQNYNATKGRYR